eukprot:2770373-Prymnesium_polylepis.1
MERQQLGRFLKSGALRPEVETITSSINEAFELVDFNYSINFDQPAPMNYPINQLTVYIEYDQAASTNQLSMIQWDKLEFVLWSESHRPFMC